MTLPRSVLDASALMALMHEGRGADIVGEAIANGAAVGLVNVAEVLSKFAEVGQDPAAVLEQLRGARDAGALSLEPLTESDCVEIARLRPLTRAAGLSLADRACLALAARLNVPAITADRDWHDADLEIEVRLIR
ncbi:MAG: type II toxin-antitoxin system VapC family toxin [Solirubrobacteraceae bacterium]